MKVAHAAWLLGVFLFILPKWIELDQRATEQLVFSSKNVNSSVAVSAELCVKFVVRVVYVKFFVINLGLVQYWCWDI